MSFLLALTGSIGMGKSTTAGMFAARGVKVWDADQAVHRLYAADGAGTKVVFDLYPEAVTDLGVNRDVLRDGIRANPDLLKELQARVHPLVAQDRANFIAANAGEDILLFDIPLVFELGNEGAFDAVAVVSVDSTTQRERVLARDGMTEESFAFILSKQMPDTDKRAKADYIIDTTSLETAQRDVDAILSKVRAAHA